MWLLIYKCFVLFCFGHPRSKIRSKSFQILQASRLSHLMQVWYTTSCGELDWNVYIKWCCLQIRFPEMQDSHGSRKCSCSLQQDLLHFWLSECDADDMRLMLHTGKNCKWIIQMLKAKGNLTLYLCSIFPTPSPSNNATGFFLIEPSQLNRFFLYFKPKTTRQVMWLSSH